MGKKKLEILFKIDLNLDEKIKVSKAFLKGYLEEKIKGLQIMDYASYTTSKDSIRAEVVTNLLNVLNASDLIKDQVTAVEEYKKLVGYAAAEKLLEKIRTIIEHYNDKTKKKTLVENLPKFLESLENKCADLCTTIARIEEDSKKLKGDLSSPLTSPIYRKKSTAEELDQTTILIKNLESDNTRLKECNMDLEEKLKMYQMNVGDKIFLEKIGDLEKEIKTMKKIHMSELDEKESKIKMLSFKLLEKTDAINELEEKFKAENKDDILDASKNIEAMTKKVIELEERVSTSQKFITRLESKLTAKEEVNKNLSSNLAKSIEEKRLMENEIIALKQTLEEQKMVGTAPPREITLESPVVSEPISKPSTELDDLMAEVKAKNIKLCHLTTLLSGKEEEIVKCMDDYEQIKSQMKKMKEEVKLAKEDVIVVGDKGRDLQNKIMELDDEISKLKADNASYKDKLEKSQELVRQKNEEKIKLTKMISDRNQIIKDNEDRYIGYEKNKEELEKIILHLQGKLKDPNIQAQERNLLDEKIENYEKEIQKLKEELNNPLRGKNSEDVVDDLNAKIKEANQNNENLKKIIQISSQKVSEYIEEIKTRDNIIKEFQERIFKLEKRCNDLSPKREKLTKDNEVDESLEKLLEEKEKELKELESKYNTSLKKTQEEQQKLRERISTLEKESIEHSSTSKSGNELQDEVKALKKQIIDLQLQLTNEKSKVQYEQEKNQSIIQGLNKELSKKCEEIKKFEVNVNEIMTQNTSKNISSVVEEEYLKEIVYLYKTLVTNSKETIEGTNSKIQNIQMMATIKNQMADKNINKDKLREIVSNSLPLFPYLVSFNMKTDYKFIVLGILNVADYKLKKMSKYESEVEKDQMIFKYSKQKLEMYNEKLNMLSNRKP